MLVHLAVVNIGRSYRMSVDKVMLDIDKVTVFVFIKTYAVLIDPVIIQILLL